MRLVSFILSPLAAILLAAILLAAILLAAIFACAETAPNRIMPQLAAIRKVFTVAILISPSGVFQIYRVDTVHVETIDPARRRDMKMASYFRSICIECVSVR